jgi:hypothetical protein
MFSRLLALRFCLMLCFRLCHRLTAAGYYTGRWLRLWFNGPVLGGFWNLRSISVPHLGRFLGPQKRQRSALLLAVKSTVRRVVL